MHTELTSKLVMLGESIVRITIRQLKVFKPKILTHIRQMDLSIIIIWMSPLLFLGALGVIFSFYLIFSMKLLVANSIAPEGTPHSAASHLGLSYLPMSHSKELKMPGLNE